ncbi:CLI_3235 family bacteriocin precursor [Ruminiclostridium papyrosolvens]|uniref:Bacteriocin n=1 Tax=Ruminiclostridium papyrosolvens C7 TaxID=1330534 RepID=U4R532_9FIRM|nr:CLI_3235 family bacteriocin precursor [Ruminiclostridium papyrosolvens]EPR13696.1 bacteriocin [Ruminiclostridium papyrosolvens C7]
MKKLSKRSDVASNTISAFDLCSSNCNCYSFCVSHCKTAPGAEGAISSSLISGLYSDVKGYAG